MTPALVLKNSGPFLSLGSPSGTRIVNAVVQTIVNVIDFEMTLQAAVECPRVHWSGDELEVEGHFSESVFAGLTGLGYKPIKRQPWDRWLGSIQAVGVSNLRDDGPPALVAVGDPRRGSVPGGINSRSSS